VLLAAIPLRDDPREHDRRWQRKRLKVEGAAYQRWTQEAPHSCAGTGLAKSMAWPASPAVGTKHWLWVDQLTPARRKATQQAIMTESLPGSEVMLFLATGEVCPHQPLSKVMQQQRSPWKAKTFRMRALRVLRRAGIITSDDKLKNRDLWNLLESHFGSGESFALVSVYQKPVGEQKTRSEFLEARQQSKAFYASDEWKFVRYQALQKYGARCHCCGATRDDGVQIHVDHIKPRSKYPRLALDINNLQILCEPCNKGKSAWDETDWRNQKPGKEVALWGDTWGEA
jgi:5-methylcytosine-specific restriction endonuclease McrA